MLPPMAGIPQPRRLPPQSYFLVSAVFHYLGPSLAVLLFARLDVLGVAWLRIATAAIVFAVWRRPWRLLASLDAGQRRVLLALGAVLAAMNSLFYLAVDRLPLSTVGAIEFLGTVLLAVAGARTKRNAAALALTTGGVAVITVIRFAGHPLGFAFAFGNCVLFMVYVMLGHRIATKGQGIDQLGAAMLIAAVAATPFGLGGALPAFSRPLLLAAGAGVGVCSSVIPYVTDQLAMARLPRATFALMLALLPVFATIIGAIVLRQLPTPQDIAGIALVTAGVAIHKQASHKQASHKQAIQKQGGNDHGVCTAGIVRPEGVPDLPGHDELRQPGRAGLAFARRRGGAAG
jgi:inner membrane transporter RhtA